jgi:hypothetical protein
MKLIYGKYYCTEDGNVFNSKGKQLKPYSVDGYYKVCIFEKGTQLKRRVHRLIWEYFNGTIPENLQINHINGIKTDNRLVNLELQTCLGNMRHARKLGLIGHRRKPYRVLCVELNRVFDSIADASQFIKVHPATLHRYFTRGLKTCGGYTWKKLED